MLLSKSDDWEYECEYRILCRNGDIDKEPTTTLCKTSGDYLELSPNAIARIIVGNRGDLDKVREVARRSRADLPVVQRASLTTSTKSSFPSYRSAGGWMSSRNLVRATRREFLSAVSALTVIASPLMGTSSDSVSALVAGPEVDDIRRTPLYNRR